MAYRWRDGDEQIVKYIRDRFQEECKSFTDLELVILNRLFNFSLSDQSRAIPESLKIGVANSVDIKFCNNDDSARVLIDWTGGVLEIEMAKKISVEWPEKNLSDKLTGDAKDTKLSMLASLAALLDEFPKHPLDAIIVFYQLDGADAAKLRDRYRLSEPPYRGVL